MGGILRPLALGVLFVALTTVSASAASTQGPAVDAAASAGIYQVTQSIGATVGDVSGDGRPDLLLNRTFAATARLYINGGGKFGEIDAGTFLRNDKHGCAIADVNGDHLADIYCAVGASHGTDVKSNELWIQQADGGFVNEAKSYNVVDPYGRSRAVVFFDANNDGWPDLFVSNFYPRPDGIPSPNRFYLNQGGTSFQDSPSYGLDLEVGGLAMAPGCAQAYDYNRDGYLDLLLCGKTSIHVYRNDGGKGFTDVTAQLGLSGVWYGAEFADLNNDGKADLAMIKKAALQIRLQQPDGRFNVVSIKRTLVGGRALAIGDINADGFPDIYALQGATGPNQTPNPPDIMYQNVGGTNLVTVRIPETSAGNGAGVSMIDYNGDGIADFIVTNGARELTGPVQLISFPPPT
ncbi:MAG: hypothetical protein QOI39_728 [Mycobacterium sp.]|nr:hypothetical protein [Mycobacterium sp.]